MLRSKKRNNSKNSHKEKKISVNSSNRSSTRLALVAILLLIGVIGLGKFMIFYKNLYQPTTAGIVSDKSYVWEGKTSINVILKTNSLYLLSYDPNDEKATILNIPSESYIEVPRDFGSWRADAIYDLGQAEKPAIGANLVKESLTNLLGIPIEGFIAFPKAQSDQDINQLIADLSKNPLLKLVSSFDVDSDLTPLELFTLSSGLSKVRADKIATLDLAQSKITKSRLLPDSSRVLGIDKVNLDLFIRENLVDTQIVNEGVSIAIYNATAYPGLAQEAARVVTNLGADAIIVANSENYTDKTVVLSDGESITFLRLAQFFAPECLKIKCISYDSKLINSRAKISIILGEDYYIRRMK